MIVWLFLVIAIVTEVFATTSLKLAVSGSRLWFIGVGSGYATAFSMLSLVLAGGMPIGVAYGIWAAAGVALTALTGTLLFKEPLTWLMCLGISLIVGGVLLLEFGGQSNR